MAIRQQRTYDSVYDATYTVSGHRDHFREQTRASGFLMEAVPEFSNYFSELAHHPSRCYRFKGADKLPSHVDRDFHPSATTKRELQWMSGSEQISGTNRYKFFRRPFFNAIHEVGIPLATPDAPPESKRTEEEAGTVRTVGVQSDYRESEAQTLPWEPEFRLPDEPTAKQQYRSAKFHCRGPELLELRDLTFGEGLPAGLNEIDHIDKMRAKRAFEATLPPIDDLERLPLRQRMIEEWENREWAERAGELSKLQGERLSLLQEALEYREQLKDEELEETVQRRKDRTLKRLDNRLTAVEKERIKTIRHLNTLRKQAREMKPERKATLVQKYGNQGSSVYAPLQREGQFPDNRPKGKEIVTETFQPETDREVVELERYMSRHLKEVKVKAPVQVEPSGYRQRVDAEVQKDLESMGKALEAARKGPGRGHGDCWIAPLEKFDANLGEKTEKIKIAARPPTPTVDEDEDETVAAIVVLQRLLRGRAVQNDLFEGMSRRYELIQELKLEESISKDSEAVDATDNAEREMDRMLGHLVSRVLREMAAPPTEQDAPTELQTEESAD